MTDLLLDTHIFLWLNGQPEKLSKRALEICADPKNAIYLSSISPWEIQITSQLGKLHISVPWQTICNYEIIKSLSRLQAITRQPSLFLIKILSRSSVQRIANYMSNKTLFTYFL